MFRELSKLINEHDKYPLFGMLLFTEIHPHVIKTLKDVDYYSALDKISGDEIALFSTMLFHSKPENLSLSPDNFHHMVPIWKEPEENKKILRWFDIKDSQELPALVIFGYGVGNIYYQKYSISSNSSLGVFNKLNIVLSRVSDSVRNNKNNGRVSDNEIFEGAQWEIIKLQAKQKLKDILEQASLFRGAIGF
jgi:hypothetical protein